MDLIYLIGAEMLIKVKFVIELAVTISGLTYVSFRSIVYARRVRYNRPYEWYEEYYMLDTFLIIYFLCLLVYCICKYYFYMKYLPTNFIKKKSNFPKNLFFLGSDE